MSHLCYCVCCSTLLVIFATLFYIAVLIGIAVGGTSTASANAKRSRNQLSIEDKGLLCARKASHGQSHVDLLQEFDCHQKVTFRQQKGTISQK